jgi:hypothetical protein
MFICESCAILSLHGLFMRVVLFYHYRVYLWELCDYTITGFICESCAILSLHGITTLRNKTCKDRIEQHS